MQKRGQASIELVMIIGFALVIILPLTIIFYEYMINSFEDTNDNQAGLIVRRLAESANKVYYLGYPSQMSLDLYLPYGIESLAIGGKEITFRMRSGSDIIYLANVNMTGNFSVDSGRKKIIVTTVEDSNIINISEDVN